MSWIVDFEPGMHGPFESRAEADAWVMYVLREHAERDVDHGWHLVELGAPDIVPDAVLPPELRRSGLRIDSPRRTA